ncbi:MAG: efflux RND transporter periplasmic adaptor subunit [Marinilabiliaceae bacterium]|nr:efflux RND transporter periplasmic adaptor subunit [Marinilabiliaceae bacterium]
MKGKNKWVLFGILLSITIGCSTPNAEKNQPLRKVKVQQVQKASPNLRNNFSGIVKEAREVNLAFRVAGPIMSIHVKPGDFVKKGDVIAEIDPRDYQIQANVAQAEYDKVLSETKRVAELYQRKSVAEVDYQKAMAGEKMITAQLQHARHQLNDTKLFAPFSGYIQVLNYETGEMVNTGMTIATLIDMEYYQIEVEIPTSLFILKDQFTAFWCKQNELDSMELPLKLTNYNIKANNNQLYKLYFRLNPALNKQIAPGMNIQVFIDYTNPLEYPYFVPLKAVFNEQGQSFVWIYDVQSSSVEKRQVVTDGLTGGGGIYIIKGLSANESIVVAGVHVLNNHQKVEVMKPVSDTNIGGLL